MPDDDRDSGPDPEGPGFFIQAASRMGHH